jgi:hypothetical protein
MQKINFIEVQLSDNEWYIDIVKQKKKKLTNIWKTALRDPSKISKHYED